MDNSIEDVTPIEDPDAKPTPKEVLFEEMYFYRKKAIKIGRLIAKYLKEEGGRGQELVALYKHMTNLKKDIVDVATKLAPYEHAKLESIELKAEIEHKYVIRAPMVAATTQDFLKLVGRQDKAPVMTNAINDGLHNPKDDIRNTTGNKQAYLPPKGTNGLGNVDEDFDKDEYGNTWNEVTLGELDLKAIQLSPESENQERTVQR